MSSSRPMVRERPARRLRPTRLGRKPLRCATASICASVSGLSSAGWLKARDTVAGDLDDRWSAWRLAAHSVPREELSR
ncbi:Uncharacterised protein [Bordetella pertussis]|nr:Uncharacterised protein [Bordetella pertussis]